MIIFPAVDLQNGKAVRLRQGVRDQSTVFAENPETLGEYWRDQGAEWLHIVDLDGAFDGESANLPIIRQLAASGLKTQVGGGIRTLERARQLFDLGVTRLIIGTVALEEPETFAAMCAKYPGRIGVSLDTRNGVLKARGWVTNSDKRLETILPELEDVGAAFIIHTDIERDGMHTGPNLIILAKLLKLVSLPVIAAGGVSTLEDIKNISALNPAGVIAGRALYDNTLDFKSAKAWLETSGKGAPGIS